MEIDPERRRRLGEVAHEYGLDLVVAFGSRTRGKVHSESDLDLAVGLRFPLASNDRWLEIYAALGGIFPENEVDVVELHRADPLLLRKIFETPILLFGEPDRFAEARRIAFHRVEDYRPFLRLERDAVHRCIGLDVA